MPETSTLKPIPAPLLYPLLKALNPPRALKGRFKAPKGMKVNPAAKRSLQATLTAAEEAKSPQQFASLLQGGTATNTLQANGSWGAITELTVQYTKDGYTIITVVYEKGNMPLVVVYPTT
ncbi:MAG TPA: hypothetical protein VNN08_11360 [Thermoanaerobaculia bacterium]|nr:hypothetical protein [Thermoanaerobaculia bacterium]